MSKKKQCEGCTHSPWSCWFSMYNNEGYCPCSECIVKPACSKTCDKFWSWGAGEMKINGEDPYENK